MTKKTTTKPAKASGKRGALKEVKAAAKREPSKRTASKGKPTVERAGVGRPSGYSDTTAAAICGWLRQGYTLRQIAALPNMPSKSTIIQWLGEHQEFQDQYARAREVHAMLMEDEILEIAEDSRNDWLEREGKDGTMEIVPNPEMVARAKVRIDSRKWLMGKMAPKRYGDRLAVTGKDGGPLEHKHTTVAGLLDEIDGAGTGLPAHGSTIE